MLYRVCSSPENHVDKLHSNSQGNLDLKTTIFANICNKDFSLLQGLQQPRKPCGQRHLFILGSFSNQISIPFKLMHSGDRPVEGCTSLGMFVCLFERVVQPIPAAFGPELYGSRSPFSTLRRLGLPFIKQGKLKKNWSMRSIEYIYVYKFYEKQIYEC